MSFLLLLTLVAFLAATVDPIHRAEEHWPLQLQQRRSSRKR